MSTDIKQRRIRRTCIAGDALSDPLSETLISHEEASLLLPRSPIEPAGKLKWWQAARDYGRDGSQMRRWRERLNEHGYSGLCGYRRRKPSPKRVPMQMVEQV